MTPTTQLDESIRLPRYLRLAEELRRQIETGGYKPGDQMPSFSEMRTQLGVPQSMLERAYGLLEKDGLIERLSRRGTFVAEPGVKALTSTIVLVVPALDVAVAHDVSAYWLPLLGGIRESVQESGYRLIMVDRLSDTDLDRCDGLLLAQEPTSEVLSRVSPQLPVSFVNYDPEGVGSVTSDDAGGIHQAVTHLLELGHRSIGYLTSPLPFHAPRRLHSYRETMRAAGIEVPESWICQGHANLRNTPIWGHAVMQSWLRDGWPRLDCTALLTYNDGTAVGAIRALREAGIRVPEDVSVVGFDGTEWCEYMAPPLTSVEVPLRQMGARAGEMLLGRIRAGQPGAGRETPASIVLATRLVVRGSTCAPRKI